MILSWLAYAGGLNTCYRRASTKTGNTGTPEYGNIGKPLSWKAWYLRINFLGVDLFMSFRKKNVFIHSTLILLNLYSFIA